MMIHDYHIRQYEQCYEMTSQLLDFMDRCTAGVGKRAILDVACGAGANVYQMLKRWPGCNMTGVDIDADLVAYARSRVPASDAHRCLYQEMNLFDLPVQYDASAFNIITLVQTLQMFGPDEYDEVLRALIRVAGEWVFLTALFTDKRMDVTSLIRDYVRFGEESKETINYNIYCMSRFRRICEQLGVKECIFQDFSISIDLVGPPEGGIGTYTLKMADGERLQFSGAVFMPWKFVALRLK